MSDDCWDKLNSAWETVKSSSRVREAAEDFTSSQIESTIDYAHGSKDKGEYAEDTIENVRDAILGD